MSNSSDFGDSFHTAREDGGSDGEKDNNASQEVEPPRPPRRFVSSFAGRKKYKRPGTQVSDLPTTPSRPETNGLTTSKLHRQGMTRESSSSTRNDRISNRYSRLRKNLNKRNVVGRDENDDLELAETSSTVHFTISSILTQSNTSSMEASHRGPWCSAILDTQQLHQQHHSHTLNGSAANSIDPPDEYFFVEPAAGAEYAPTRSPGPVYDFAEYPTPGEQLGNSLVLKKPPLPARPVIPERAPLPSHGRRRGKRD